MRQDGMNHVHVKIKWMYPKQLQGLNRHYSSHTTFENFLIVSMIKYLNMFFDVFKCTKK